MQIIRNEHVTAGNGLITLYLILQFYSLYSSLNVLKYKLLPIVSGRGFYVRNSYLRLVRGYIQNGGRGGTGIPPPPRNLEIEYDYYCFVTGINNNLVPDSIRSNLRGSKFKIFLGGWGGGGGMPSDPPSRHTRYYHPATVLSYPPQLKILYETLI